MTLEGTDLEQPIEDLAGALDRQAMVARLIEGADSLQAAFRGQFAAQFERRFDLDSEADAEQWKDLLESVDEFVSTEPRWPEEFFDAHKYWMHITGHPGARIDWSTRWGLIEQGESGVLYNVPDSDSGETELYVEVTWRSNATGALSTFAIESARDIIQNPQWGWSFSCGLPLETLRHEVEAIVGPTRGDWVRALLQLLEAKPWVTHRALANASERGPRNEFAAAEFLEQLSLSSDHSSLPDEDFEWVRLAYWEALGEWG